LFIETGFLKQKLSFEAIDIEEGRGKKEEGRRKKE
jgi:hypothetical protein